KVINLGASSTEEVSLSVERVLPTGEVLELFTGEIGVPNFDSTVQLKFPTESGNFIGRNVIRARLNEDQALDEWPSNIAYSNNTLANNFGENGFPFFVFGFNVEPVFPTNFAIIPDQNVSLKASVFSPQITEEDFIVFELDSTPDFNSPLKMRDKIGFLPGNLPSWTPGIGLEEGKVYFWRVSQDSLNEERPYNWKVSSFTYVAEQTGWSQSHWAQFAQD